MYSAAVLPREAPWLYRHAFLQGTVTVISQVAIIWPIVHLNDTTQQSSLLLQILQFVYNPLW